MKRVMYAAGCYGTGNLGDDAIFDGLRNMYNGLYNVVQVYVQEPTCISAVTELELLKLGFPAGTERLIIGGGGLFFDVGICGTMNLLADLAIGGGTSVSVEAVGIETAPKECYCLISELLAKCDRITVRSNESRRIAKEIGFEVSVVQDFAYNISPDIDSAKNIMPVYDDSLPVIGVATGDNRDIGDPLRVVLELLNEFNVLHLPHTAFRFAPGKVATGQSIGQTLADRNSSLLKRYKYLPYPDTPGQLLGVYRLLGGIVGYRYHSYIFAEMAEVPLYPRNGLSTLKSRGYFEDHPDMITGIDGTPDKAGDILRYFRGRT